VKVITGVVGNDVHVVANSEAEGWSLDLPILKGKYPLKDVTFVIGGNLAVGEVSADILVPKYQAYGFYLVFH